MVHWWCSLQNLLEISYLNDRNLKTKNYKMKAKLILLSLAMVGFAMSASAQTKEKYTSNGADNIFVSVTGGISSVYSGKSDGKFGKIAPHFTVSLGKWFNPVVGIRGQVGFWRVNYYTMHSMGNLIPSNGNYAKYGENKIGYDKGMLVTRFDFMYNITNAIMGYDSNRLFNLIAFGGLV